MLKILEKNVGLYYFVNRLSELYGHDYSDMNVGGDFKRIISLID